MNGMHPPFDKLRANDLKDSGHIYAATVAVGTKSAVSVDA